MKILLLSTLYPPIGQGGAERAASLLAEALVRGGDSVVVVTLHSGKDPIAEVLNGVRVYRLPLDNIYWPFLTDVPPHTTRRLLWHLHDAWNWKAARRVAAVLDLERPDVLHTHSICGFSISVWREARKRGIKVVHTTHDYYLLCLRSDMFLGGRPCAKRCLKCRLGTLGRRIASSRLDEVISVSAFSLEMHRRNGYFAGVSTSVVNNISPSAGNSLRRPRALNSGELVFGFIGRVEEQKGIIVLLSACRLLSCSNWRLRIAGRGRPDSIDELKRANPDGRIDWLGYADAKTFYASIDVAVVPSVWADPLPYVAIEALQSGKSLIAANSGGIPEIAALGRQCAVYSAEDEVALAARMNAALENAGQWRDGGFIEEAARELFSAETVIERHKSMYLGRELRPTVTSPSEAIRAPSSIKTT